MHKTRQETVRRELKIICEDTVVVWYNFCREVCSEVIENETITIGGSGTVLEIDQSTLESQFITREGERKAFACLAESRGTKNADIQTY